MPGEIREQNSAGLVQAIKTLELAIESQTRTLSSAINNLNVSFPNEVSITELKESQQQLELIVGQGEMTYSLFDHASELIYPPELQPSMSPLVNEFKYTQLHYSDTLFHVSGQFEATGTTQIDPQVLADYNTDNGTSFGDRPIDKLILPIQNTSGTDIPLPIIAESDWINANNGSIIDHVEPLFAVWLKDTNQLELKFDKGTWSVPFGSNLTWDIKLSFSSVARLDPNAIFRS